MRPKKTAPSRLGVGLYSIPEAARIVGAPIGRIRTWISPREALIARFSDPTERTVSFLELMELHFVKMFRSEGVSLQTIRRAACAASRKFQADYPFAVRTFDTDGRTIFATLIRDESDEAVIEAVIEDLKRGQYVFKEILHPFFRKLEYHGTEEVIRYWPLEPKGRIVLDPQRHFGKPIDAKTGVPTRPLYEAVKAGEEFAVVAEWFDVPLELVTSAVKFEESLAA